MRLESLTKVFGKPGTAHRQVIYVLAFIVGITTLVALSERMTWYWWAITFFSALLLFLVLFLQVGGWKLFKCYRHLIRIRAAIDHAATTAGARVDTKVGDFSDKLHCYYSFPDGQVVALSVSENGVLNFQSPPPEKMSEAIEAFIQKIREVRGF